MEYECHAEPGTGNFKILSSIVSQASLDDPALFLINWTWIDRFDFVDGQEQWITILPGDRNKTSDLYYKHFHSQIKDMMTSIYAINTAIDFLRERNIPFLMTYMDYSMLHHVDANWHDPKYISVMQDKVRRVVIDFQGKNFLDWSREKKFDISDAWHPLEEAHKAAADYMQPFIDTILRKV